WDPRTVPRGALAGAVVRSAALLVIAIAGCGDGRTLLTVEIQSPLEVPEQLDRLCVSSRVDGGSMTALGYGRGTNLGGDRLLPGLPATVVFEDKDDEFDQITVSTEGTWRGRPVGRGLARA